MLQIGNRRINDPIRISPAEILDACIEHGHLVVQFSRPEAYSDAILDALNEACRLAEDRIQVRFYGHYGACFDATVLKRLPEARDIAVDCPTTIVNEDEIGKLPKLEKLSFGVFEFDRPDFLDTIGLGTLRHLAVSETRKRNFNLGPLARSEKLETLLVHGHANGIEAIAGLPRLKKLILSAYARKHSLSFVEGISNLNDLQLILGGRDNIHDLSSDSLEILQIIRVRGLAKLGDLSRLPSLSALRVEDQLQLEEIDLHGANLERLWLFNCRTLAALPGLENQRRLTEFRTSQVALDLNALRDRDWPPSARSVHLFSGSRKWNEQSKMRLTERGLGEQGSYWL